jgi:hypothetical protein
VPEKPDAPSASELVRAIKRDRDVIVTNGPFVKVSIDGKGMGQLATTQKGKARLDVAVQAAPWIDVRHLEVFVNGSRRGKPIDIPASQKPLRFQGSVELKIDRDAYVVVVVRGDAPLGPVLPPDEGQTAPTPLVIANPIFVDRDGDGRYTPQNPPPRSTPQPPLPSPPPKSVPPKTAPPKPSKPKAQSRMQKDPPPIAVQVPDGAH